MIRLVPGIHSVIEVLKVRPKSVRELWIREGDLHENLQKFLDEARTRHIPVKRASLRMLDREVQSHQGVIAFVESLPDWPSSKTLKNLTHSMIFVLDGFEDPHNVGSIMRSAWNLDATGVILPKDNSAGFAPASQKVACGAFEHLPVLEVANLSSELMSLKELGFWIYGLSEAGDSVFKMELAPKAVFVIGSEESGLRKPVSGACDVLIGLPQASTASSFNASVTGAIVGFEFLRQRNLSQRSKDSTEKI